MRLRVNIKLRVRACMREASPIAEADANELNAAKSAVRRHQRVLRWGGFVLVGVGIGVLPVGLLFDPAATARAFGTASQVDAVVTSVDLSPDQPRKDRNGERWTVKVSWPEGEGTRSGTDHMLAHKPPFTVGATTPVYVNGAENEVSLAADGDGRVWLILAVGVAMIIGGVGAWWRTRRWSELLKVITQRAPERVKVKAVERRRGRRHVVDYSPDAPGDVGGSFMVERRSDDAIPEVGETVDVWPLRENGRGPFIVRRVSSGTWWAGTGADPVPAISRR